MRNCEEIELKLRVMDDLCWQELCEYIRRMESAVQYEEIEMAATYYDTREGDLRNAKAAYRIRSENGRRTATIKGGGSSAGGLHRRKEWNVQADDDKICAAAFKEMGVDEHWLSLIFGRELVALTETNFTRGSVTLQLGDDVVEAAMDRGKLRAGNKEAAILEIELESKRGSAAAALRLGAMLAERYPLALERRSKYLRGLLLAGAAVDEKASACADRELEPVCRLLDFISDAWISGEPPNKNVYQKYLTPLQNIFPEVKKERPLYNWIEKLEKGIDCELRLTISFLLRMWASVISGRD